MKYIFKKMKMFLKTRKHNSIFYFTGWLAGWLVDFTACQPLLGYLMSILSFVQAISFQVTISI